MRRSERPARIAKPFEDRLDTNVLVSGILSPQGAPATVLRSVASGSAGCSLAVSPLVSVQSCVKSSNTFSITSSIVSAGSLAIKAALRLLQSRLLS